MIAAIDVRKSSRQGDVEGHVRLTSYALYPAYLPESLEVLVGLSDDVRDWWAF